MKNKPSKFMELLETFFDRHLPVSVGVSPNTIKSYKYAFRLLLEYMYNKHGIPAGDISFEDLNYENLTGFLDWLENERHCSVSTKNQRLPALLSFSGYAQNRGFDAAAVFRSSLLKIPLKKGKKQLRTIFTVPEITILLQMPDETRSTGLRNKVLLSTMYASGARAQEICDLTVRNVCFNSNETASLILTGKGRKARKIGIPARCAKMLRQYPIHQGIQNQSNRHVFSSQTHEHMSVSCVEEIFKKYVGAAREKHTDMFMAESYPPHAMRHTTASHMLEAGIPLVVIKNFLGHVSLSSTLIYAEMTQDTTDRHLREWNEKWFGSEPVESGSDTENKMPGFLSVK